MKFNVEHFLYISIVVMIIFSVSAIISDSGQTEASEKDGAGSESPEKDASAENNSEKPSGTK
ncbi:hypothetical protein NEAUS04_1577 [Nematocida ausubeli]|nr:hypothetical protein NEAUS06_0791 [Nematocida ausubeli]KAI5147782.1 hypothetical protein NEAUS05_1065 [Nematocida ausubeli]KAI5163455.1 hypothetical protein NEAUS04_1577 [Nematocida ausubeli]